MISIFNASSSLLFVYVYDAPLLINERVQREARASSKMCFSSYFDRKRAKEFGARCRRCLVFATWNELSSQIEYILQLKDFLFVFSSTRAKNLLGEFCSSLREWVTIKMSFRLNRFRAETFQCHEAEFVNYFIILTGHGWVEASILMFAACFWKKMPFALSVATAIET